MHEKHRSSAGTRVRSALAAPMPELTFRADLLKPQQSQISQYSDAVSDRIAQLDLHAQHLGEGFGIPSTGFVLNPPPDPTAGDAASLALAVLRALATREERISLERRNGRWGLFFTRGIALMSQDRTIESIPLRDAPLDVRERFLLRSHEFFSQYLKLCEDRLGRMKDSVGCADQTLRLLGNVRLTP
jgi:hypothetical protein